MRKNVLIALSGFSYMCLRICVNAYGQTSTTGLQFLPAEQLIGIPLASTPYSGTELPSSVDLADQMPPAGDQGAQNSCVAWAVAYAGKSYQEMIEEKTSYLVGTTINPTAVFSPAFIYNQINNGRDGGSFFPEALNLLSQTGAVKWAEMPYDPSDYLTPPSTTLQTKAKNYRIDFWRRVNVIDLKEVKAQLNANYPVLIGASLTQNFVSEGWAAAGNDYYWRNTSGEEKGGHAMIVVGYDDSRAAFKVLNSWGRGWGNNGYCWITYQLFPTVVREGYVMKDAANANNPSSPVSPATDPTPATPLKDLTTVFDVQQVLHQQTNPAFGAANPLYSIVMRIGGRIKIPTGVGNNWQVVVKFYLNVGNLSMPVKGPPIRALFIPGSSQQFAMPDGSAATGTATYSVNQIAPLGITTWAADVAYFAFDVPRGGPSSPLTTYMVAEPQLYVDNFAVKTAPIIPFFVSI